MMPVELSELMQLALGQRDHLKMGDLPRPIADFMKCHPAVVYLGKKEFRHIATRHPEMKREEFQMAPFLIKNGSYYFHQEYPRCVTIFGEMGHDNKRYTIGLKSAGNGGEVWVQTMFRISGKKAERRIRNGTCIRI